MYWRICISAHSPTESYLVSPPLLQRSSILTLNNPYHFRGTRSAILAWLHNHSGLKFAAPAPFTDIHIKIKAPELREAWRMSALGVKLDLIGLSQRLLGRGEIEVCILCDGNSQGNDILLDDRLVTAEKIATRLEQTWKVRNPTSTIDVDNNTDDDDERSDVLPPYDDGEKT